MGAEARGAVMMWCFFAQLESTRHANGNARAAVEARETIWSDRSADARRGQEQNRRSMAFRGMEQFVRQMVLRVSAGSGQFRAGSSRADVHFFLDFRLKEPYI